MISSIFDRKPVAALIVINIIFFVACAFFVRTYYQKGLPYYDSVGSYWNMFAVVNTVRNEGFISGIVQASRYPLSWLQTFFAVFSAFILPKQPEFLILINFIFLLVSQLAIFYCLRLFGFSKVKSVFVSLFTLLPQSLVNWAGGYIDMRRDASYFSLLLSVYFLMSAYIKKNNIKTGMILGIVTGLTQWSRGNALPYILIVFLSSFISYLRLKNGQIQIWQLLKKSIAPLTSFLIIALPFYYFQLTNVINKYLYGSWALSTPLAEASFTFLNHLFLLWFGSGQEIIKLNFIFMVLISCLFVFLTVTGRIKIYLLNAFEDTSLYFLFSGIMIFILMLILNVFIIRIGVLATVIPSFPVLIGFFAIISFISGTLSFSKKSAKWRFFLPLTFSIYVLTLNTVRIHISQPGAYVIKPSEVKKIAVDLSKFIGIKPVSFLWLDHIHVHDLNFYLTQAGGRPIQAGSLLSPGVDTEMPPDQDMSVKEQQFKFAEGIRKREFIIVSENSSVYENPQGFFFMFMHGKPVIDDLLKDNNYKTVYRFSNGIYPFAVLQKI